MPGIIHGGAQQVIHGCIQHHKAPRRTLLLQDNARQQHPRRPGNPAPRFQHDRQAQRTEFRLDRPSQRRRRGRDFIAIGNAKPSAAIHTLNRQALRANGPHQFSEARIGSAISAHAHRDLTADMRCNPDRANGGQRGHARVKRQCIIIGDAKFVFAKTRGDLGVGLRIHIRIDANANRRGAPHAGGDGGNHIDFLNAFGIDLHDAFSERQADFAFGFANAGKDNRAGGNAGKQRAAQFAFTHHISAKPFAAKQRQHRKIVIGLGGEMHGRGQTSLGQGSAQRPRTAAQSAGGIDPSWRAHHFGNALKRHIFHHQPIMGVARQLRALCQQFGEGRVRAQIKGRSRGGHPPIVVMRADYRKRESARSAIWVLPGMGDFLGGAGRADRAHAAASRGQEGHCQQKQ